MLVSTYLFPAIAAYNRHEYEHACMLLYSFNSFFQTFGDAIEDLPTPRDPARSDIRDRVNPMQYYHNYFDKYLPAISKVLGKYQKVELELVKEERGRY